MSDDARIIFSGKETQSIVISQLSAIETRLANIEVEQQLLRQKIDDLQTSVYWVLAAIGIFIACVTIPSIIALMVSIFRSANSSQDKPGTSPIILQIPPYPYYEKPQKESV